ncbi:MAG: hypothetical protein R3C56_39580 [Pirellulaceae bacterium]
MEEAHQRGWDELDVVIVTGDAYIDHPQLRHEHPGPRARSGRSRGNHLAAQLAFLR